MSHDHFLQASLTDDMSANIPVLHEAIDQDWLIEDSDTQIHDDDGIVTLSLKQAIIETKDGSQDTQIESIAGTPTNISQRTATAGSAKTAPQKSQNPFLPQHILDRLNHGKRNLVEEIAQSGAALDASTALLRNRALVDSMHRASAQATGQSTTGGRDKNAHKKQQMIDDLVDEYLPLLAAELRRRLRKVLDE